MSSLGLNTQIYWWLAAIAIAALIGSGLARKGHIRLFAGMTDLIVTSLIAAIPCVAFAVVYLNAPSTPDAMRDYLGTAQVMSLQVFGISLGLSAATAAAMIALRANGAFRGVLAFLVKFAAAPAFLLLLPVLLFGGRARKSPLAGAARNLRNSLIDNSAP